MSYFDNLTSDCREKFTDMVEEFLDEMTDELINSDDFKEFKNKIEPNYKS